MLKYLLVLTLVGVCMSQNVDRVLQNFEEKINSKLVQQIKYELQASYMYQAYSHYFGRADVALPGFAKWFEKASIEERSHATGLIEYINKRGGSVALGDVKYNELCTTVSDALVKMPALNRRKACICSIMSQKKEKAATDECSAERNEWKNGLWAMQDTLVLEKFVNSELLKLHSEADSDPHLSHVLEHDYLDEQVEAIKQVGDYVRKLERVGSGLGEYMFDKEEL